MSDDSEKYFQPKEVTISAKIPFELHLAAKQIYLMKGTRIGERVQQLIRADLKKKMGRDWFKELPESEIAIYKMLIELSERERVKNEICDLSFCIGSAKELKPGAVNVSDPS